MNPITDCLMLLSFKLFDMFLNEPERSFVVSSLSLMNVIRILVNDSNLETRTDLERYIDYNNGDNLNNDMKILMENLQDFSDFRNDNLLKIENFIFYDEKIYLNSTFKTKMEEDCNAMLFFVNNIDSFEKVKKINRVLNEYHKQLPSYTIKNVSDNFSFMILNTIFYSQVWSKPFHKELKNDDFVVGDKRYSVPMMKQISSFNGISNDAFDAIKMDFQDSTYSFVAIMPKEDKNFEVIKKLLRDQKQFDDFISSLNASVIDLTFPKFDLTSVYDSYSNLNEIKDFSKNAESKEVNNFYNITKPETNQIAFIKLNQHGVFATDKTQELFNTKENVPVGSPDLKMKFNRPFMFFLVKNVVDENAESLKKNVPVFMGNYAGPTYN